MKKKTTTCIRFEVLRVSSHPGERINFPPKDTENCQKFHTAPKKEKKKICARQSIHCTVDEKSA